MATKRTVKRTKGPAARMSRTSRRGHAIGVSPESDMLGRHLAGEHIFQRRHAAMQGHAIGVSPSAERRGKHEALGARNLREALAEAAAFDAHKVPKKKRKKIPMNKSKSAQAYFDRMEAMPLEEMLKAQARAAKRKPAKAKGRTAAQKAATAKLVKANKARAGKKTTAKKSTAKKTTAKKSTAKKSTTARKPKRSAAQKAATAKLVRSNKAKAKKSSKKAARKTTKKSTAKKSTARKSTKKTAARRPAAHKATAKKSTRKPKHRHNGEMYKGYPESLKKKLSASKAHGGDFNRVGKLVKGKVPKHKAAGKRACPACGRAHTLAQHWSHKKGNHTGHSYQTRTVTRRKIESGFSGWLKDLGNA